MAESLLTEIHSSVTAKVLAIIKQNFTEVYAMYPFQKSVKLCVQLP